MNSICSIFLVCLLKYGSEAANVLGPSVYIVTPSPRSHAENEARSAPFYYHNWMRRMDSPQNATTTTTAPTTSKVKTPDLIFAEFESESEDKMRKSIRKLLEQERVAAKTSTTSTTSQPIYVPNEEESVKYDVINHSTSQQDVQKEDTKKSEVDMTDYFALYNNLYGDVNSHIPKEAPVYSPSTTTTSQPTTTTPAPTKVENIWHIIDAEKHNQYLNKDVSDNWEEVPLNNNQEQNSVADEKPQENDDKTSDAQQKNEHVPDYFALPGFSSNPGNGGENESRAIRTEPNIRFPYVSLKPFVMKNMNKPIQNGFSNSKKGGNMFNLDDFKEVRYPVRGEIQDTAPMSEPVDRYNPAQPYLPHDYGSKSKQSSGPSQSKAVSNLVPPPPPPPKATGDDFPAPTSYESFPPYPPSVLRPAPAPSPPPRPAKPPVSVYKPPLITSDDSAPGPGLDSNTDDSPMDLGYRYKPPSPPVFAPTLPPLDGYSYNKPISMPDSPPSMDMSGYSYNKPAATLDYPPTMSMGGYSYNKPAVPFDSAPPMSAGGEDSKPDLHQYLYDKPAPESPEDHQAPPDLIFDKHHGMADPPMGDPPMGDPPMDDPPMDDHGFPPDFPGDLKFPHDFDDHDFHHYHHHTTTTTTTTTEMPRVNRFSYYYLGKKLYYLPLYFSVYFIVYVGALIIKAVLRHKIVYPNSWRPNDTTASFFSKRSVDSWDLHEVTGRVTKAIAEAAEKYIKNRPSASRTLARRVPYHYTAK